jgi:hypothetical protein
MLSFVLATIGGVLVLYAINQMKIILNAVSEKNWFSNFVASPKDIRIVISFYKDIFKSKKQMKKRVTIGLYFLLGMFVFICAIVINN